MTIKDMELQTGLARANIRYYEAEGLITPERAENGYRDYSQEDAETLLRVKLPGILASTLSTIGGTATPVALLAVGASFSGSEAAKCMRPALAATAIKLFILPAIFLPIAALFGFTGSAMIAILILIGSPTTVSCYVMAKNMGHRGVLTSNVVMLATVLSSVSLTLWIFLLRLFGLL